MATQYKILVGDTDTPEIRVPTTGDDSYLAPVTLDAATGNEVAFDIQYTVNKATSGDDTGLLVNQTDTASPGTSLLADFQVGGVPFYSFQNDGQAFFYNSATDYIAFNSAAGSATGNFIEFFDGGVRNGVIWSQPSGTLQIAAGSGSGVDFELAPSSSTNVDMFNIGSSNSTGGSGQYNFVSITPAYDQTSGTASNTDLLINRTETAVGSGAQLLADFQVGGTSKFSVDNAGTVIADNASSGSLAYELYQDAAEHSKIGWGGVMGGAFNSTMAGFVGVNKQISLSSNDGTTHHLKLTATSGHITAQATTNTDTSGTVTPFQITPTYNQASGTAANTDLLINRTETAVGSGAQLLADFQVGGTSLLNIDNAGKLTLDPAGNFGTGTGIWFGDGDTGIYEASDDSLYIETAGVERWIITGQTFSSRTSNGPALRNEAVSYTNPTISPDKGDTDTGIGGGDGTDELSLIAGGVEGMRISETGGITQVEIAQGTNDAPFIDFQATADADATSAISTLTTSGATTHHIQVEINGVTAWIAASTTDPS